jgi:nucleotide-binding universal stress UspA family protein
MSAKVVVGVDGSENAGRAVAWCARYGPVLMAEVVAVFAIELPPHATDGPYALPSLMTDDERTRLGAVVARDWCKLLADAGVEYSVRLSDGNAARALIDAARAEDADLVVTGRRGRGAFAELVLGSTTYHLVHHLNRPLVIVP